MLIGARFVSPFLLITKLPRIPFFTLVLNRLPVTDARVPFDFWIAVIITSVACAAYFAYGSGADPTTLPKFLRKAFPAAFSVLSGWPATEMNMPSEALPA